MRSDDRIESFGLKESGFRAQIEDLFSLSTIDAGAGDDFFDRLIRPRRLDGAALCICQRGSGEVMIDAKIYNLKNDDMLVIFPHSIIQPLSYSADIELYVLGVHHDFIANVDIDSAVPLFLFIRENPCIGLGQQDKSVIVELCEILKSKSERRNNPYLKEISEQLLLTLFYEISAIYTREKPLEQRVKKRDEELLANFLYLVNEYFKSERGLDFYAGQMCITPKYMSQVVRQASGISAREWIASTVIINARALLKSSGMTVSQVADYLNFPNPSFFSQYFKKHAGVTPKSVQSGGGLTSHNIRK